MSTVPSHTGLLCFHSLSIFLGVWLCVCLFGLALFPPWYRDSFEKKKLRERKQKEWTWSKIKLGGKKEEKLMGKEEKRKEKTYSLPSLDPSMKGQRPQAHLDRCTLGITGDTRCPATVFRFGPHYQLPAFWLYISILYAGAEPATRLLGEATFRSQSASEWAISTSRQNCVQIQYLRWRHSYG